MEISKEIKERLAKAKRKVSRLERELVRAEKREKEAQESERANKIKALLESNSEKIVIFTTFSDEILPIKAKYAVVYLNANKCWCLKVIGEGNQWEIALEYVDDIFVKAEL